MNGRVRNFFAWIFCCLVGCAGTFHDTNVGGLTNFAIWAPRLVRMGQITTPEGWTSLQSKIPAGARVLVVKLDDSTEGSDAAVLTIPGWTLLDRPIPPEDDKPWTVLVRPSTTDVNEIVDAIVDAYRMGYWVVVHCVHGRDRTSLICALVGMRLFGWTKDQAWSDMIAHGFRWELPDLDFYFATVARAR